MWSRSSINLWSVVQNNLLDLIIKTAERIRFHFKKTATGTSRDTGTDTDACHLI